MIGAKARGHRQGRRTRLVQEGDAEDRPGSPPRAASSTRSTRPATPCGKSACRCVIRAQLHAGRHRRRHRLQPGRIRRRWSGTAWMMSPVHEVLLEESIIGWKEYEMEVMRDVDDNVVIICSIENFDPMGVHTGDSITVAPAQTLTDKEYQRMRDASMAVHPRDRRRDGRLEHPVRHPSPQRADGRHRDEPPRQPLQRPGVEGDRLPHRQDRRQAGRRLSAARDCPTTSPAKRWPASSRQSTTSSRRSRASRSRNSPKPIPTLTTQMKAVGETMAIGRTFKESFQKALRGLEVGHFGFGCDGKKDRWGTPKQPSMRRDPPQAVRSQRGTGFFHPLRPQGGHDGRRDSRSDRHRPWFLRNIRDLVAVEDEIRQVARLADASGDLIRKAKRNGFSDRQLRHPGGTPPKWKSASERKRRGIVATFKSGRHLRGRVRGLHALLLLDLRARRRDPAQRAGPQTDHDLGRRPQPHRPGNRVRLLLLPRQLRPAELGIESIMVNSNPETV